MTIVDGVWPIPHVCTNGVFYFGDLVSNYWVNYSGRVKLENEADEF